MIRGIGEFWHRLLLGPFGRLAQERLARIRTLGDREAEQRAEEYIQRKEVFVLDDDSSSAPVAEMLPATVRTFGARFPRFLVKESELTVDLTSPLSISSARPYDETAKSFEDALVVVGRSQAQGLNLLCSLTDGSVYEIDDVQRVAELGEKERFQTLFHWILFQGYYDPATGRIITDTGELSGFPVHQRRRKE